MADADSGLSKDELQERTEQAYQQDKQMQQQAVAELGQAQGLGETEVVTLGEQEIEVKSWLPGSVSETFSTVAEAEESGDVRQVLESMGGVADALSELCLTSPYDDADFWQAYHDEWGIEGVIRAFETIAEPALEGMETRLDVENQEAKQEALGNSHRRMRD